MAGTCPNCGAETLVDAVHCHRCGAKLEDATWPDAGDDTLSNQGGDWRTAARDAGVGEHQPTVPAPRDPHGPHATDAPLRPDSTNWAMLAHGSAFIAALASVGMLVFLGPLVIWLVKRDDPFVERHARQALNFNLLMLVLWLIGVAGAFLTFGIGFIFIAPIGFVVFVGWAITTVLGIVRAANGAPYSYPFNISLVK